MSIGLINLLLSCLVAALGVLTGWGWRSLARQKSSGPDGANLDHAQEVLARLRDVAAGVAADVGEHSTRVEAINEKLTAVAGSDAEVVVSAVGQLIEANSRMQEQLDSAQRRLREQEQEIESQTLAARTDALTGLGNRRMFDDEIVKLKRQSAAAGSPFSVTILDIDHFKQFNDTHGHQVGDRVLKHVASVLSTTLAATDIATRFGGEEFAVIHPAALVREAAEKADLLRRALDASTIREGDRQLHVTASLGVAESAVDEEPSRLIERADAALYSAKEAGRNRTFWNDGSTSRPYTAPAAPAEAPRSGSTPREPVAMHAGLLDRKAFSTQLFDALDAWRAGGQVPMMLLVQIDRFEELAARHGGGAAERMIDAASRVLTALARARGCVARFDSSTLAVLIRGYDSAQTVQLAEQIRKMSEQCPLPTPTGPVRYTLSIGAAKVRERDDTSRVIERAGAALDRALQAGGDCTFLHDGRSVEAAQAIFECAR